MIVYLQDKLVTGSLNWRNKSWKGMKVALLSNVLFDQKKEERFCIYHLTYYLQNNEISVSDSTASRTIIDQ